MNAKSFALPLLALTLSLSAVSAMAEPSMRLLGDPQPDAAADRVIVIKPDTKYVNVQGGEVVEFKVGERSFTWDFDGPVMSFELNRVVPQDLLDHKVTAEIARNPLYTGG